MGRKFTLFVGITLLLFSGGCGFIVGELGDTIGDVSNEVDQAIRDQARTQTNKAGDEMGESMQPPSDEFGD